jgi:hypothetical protein
MSQGRNEFDFKDTVFNAVVPKYEDNPFIDNKVKVKNGKNKQKSLI